jgi:hypothetical protein
MKVILCLLFLCTAAHAQGVNVANLPTTNGATTITTGNTFQTVLAALTQGQPKRNSLTIQNNTTNGDNCWIQFGIGITKANATEAKSILLGQGQSYTRYYPYVPSDEIEGTCATSSDTLYVDTQ